MKLEELDNRKGELRKRRDNLEEEYLRAQKQSGETRQYVEEQYNHITGLCENPTVSSNSKMMDFYQEKELRLKKLWCLEEDYRDEIKKELLKQADILDEEEKNINDEIYEIENLKENTEEDTKDTETAFEPQN